MPNWPSMDQFNQLKAVAEEAKLNTVPLQDGPYIYLSNGSDHGNVTEIYVDIGRRTEALRGIVLRGDWQLSDFAGIDIRESTNDSAYVTGITHLMHLLVVRPKAQTPGWTEIIFPQTLRIPSYGGQIHIEFNGPKTVWAGTTTIGGLNPAPTGKLIGPPNGTGDGKIAEMRLLVPEQYPMLIVPTPSVNGDQAGERQWHMELVVSPTGAFAPYLHLYTYWSVGNANTKDYYIPFTLGLPS